MMRPRAIHAPLTPRARGIASGKPRAKKLAQKLPFAALILASILATVFVVNIIHTSNTLNSTNAPQKAHKTHNTTTFAQRYFPDETLPLMQFCDYYLEQLDKGAQDPFYWIHGLSPTEDAAPFSMAVPHRSKSISPTVGRTLERQGTWAPEITNDIIDALEQAGPHSLLLDIGAGLGWFSFAAVSLNHSALIIEPRQSAVAALKRSICRNVQHQGEVVLLTQPSQMKKKVRGRDLDELLLQVAPKISQVVHTGIGKAVGAVVIHTLRGGVKESVKAMEVGANGVFGDLKPLSIVWVLDEGEERAKRSDEGAEEVAAKAAVVLHKMYGLGYDVKANALNTMSQSPIAFLGMARKVAKASDRDISVLWFVWRGE